MPLRTKVAPTGQIQLSRPVLLCLAAGVLLLVGLLVLAHRAVPSVGAIFARKAPEPMRKVDVPEVLKPSPQPYGALMTKPPVPVAQPVVAQAPPVATPPPRTPEPAPAPPAAPPPPPSFIDLWQRQQDTVAQTAREPQGPAPQPKPPAARTPWVITPTDITLKAPEGTKDGKDSKAKSDEPGRTGDAGGLIKPARWEVPKYPLRTLYRSQALIGRTLDELNSDIPGQVRVELVVPTFDKFRRDVEILPKGTLVVAVQEGRPEFGQSRLAVKVEQVEFPSGEVLSLTSKLGSEQGSNGVTGKVNAHIGKLLLASGISAMLNIGVRAGAGTPSQGNFFQNPAQSAAQDIGQSVQRDAEGLVTKQLRVPPTIVVPRGTNVTVNLAENVTFSRRAVEVK